MERRGFLILDNYNFEKLKELIFELRQPNGCPWDRKQTKESLVPQLLEEVYELVDAIHENSEEKIKEELGDVLLHIVFQIIVGEEQGGFTEKDVFKEIIEKIIRRHPHVFGDMETDDIDLINKNWETIKSNEAGKEKRKFFEGIPKSMPALLTSYKLTKKVAKVGFDWPHLANIFEKINEEVYELEEALTCGNLEMIEEEIGDVIFMIVNLCRFLKIEPETALVKTNKKFMKRFSFIEKNVDINKATLEEMDKYWEKSKKIKNL